MKNRFLFTLIILGLLIFPFSACAPLVSNSQSSGKSHVLAVESFLADIARQISNGRVIVDSLIPVGTDPHSFEPTPKDVELVAQSKMVVINGGGLESWLQPLLSNAGGNYSIVTASSGLKPRTLQPGEDPAMLQGNSTDPHFWLNPLNVITYVNNIRDGLIQIDPAGRDAYSKSALSYIAQLHDLDQWISTQVSQIPSPERLLVTNHETLGYFADQYGFRIIGSIIPSFSSDATPSAQELAALEDQIKATGVKTIFLEVGTNPQLAQQIAQDTGINVNTTLYTHSLSIPSGPAPTYIDMMKYDVQVIVNALK
jgi:ABC-type Zn uptake system ZnuABC Zn-binding protein ZnuA